MQSERIVFKFCLTITGSFSYDFAEKHFYVKRPKLSENAQIRTTAHSSRPPEGVVFCHQWIIDNQKNFGSNNQKRVKLFFVRCKLAQKISVLALKWIILMFFSDDANKKSCSTYCPTESIHSTEFIQTVRFGTHRIIFWGIFLTNKEDDPNEICE